MTKTISDPVLDVLKRSTVSGRILSLPGQLDRKLYVETNKVLEMLGGKWDRYKAGHVFPDDDAGEVVEGAVMTGAVTDFKKLYQFFETPEQLARDMIRHACLEGPGQRILEPSAGAGAIVRPILTEWRGTVDVAELDPKRNAALATMPRVRVIGSDFMQLPIAPDTYDRVIANPPFRAGQDVLHVRKMFEVLKPGGILVAVMSPSWQFRENGVHKQFRDWFNGLSHAEAEDLDAGAFASSGTNVRTVLIRIIK